MTLKDKSTIERALGIIEGIAFGLDLNLSSGLCTAIEMIEEAINQESESDTE